MKYTIEVTPNGITKTFEFEGEQYVENWVKGDSGIHHTTRESIVDQLENKGILEEYPELLETLEFDELNDLWDEMEYYQEENEE